MTLLVGFLLPALIGTVTKYIKNSDGRFWTSVVIAALFGIIINFIYHNGVVGYSGQSLIEITNGFAESIMAMVGMVKLSYEIVWNNPDVGKLLPDSKKDESVLDRLELKP